MRDKIHPNELLYAQITTGQRAKDKAKTNTKEYHTYIITLEQIVKSVRGEHPTAKPAWGVASYAVINVTSRQDRISTSYSPRFR